MNRCEVQFIEISAVDLDSWNPYTTPKTTQNFQPMLDVKTAIPLVGFKSLHRRVVNQLIFKLCHIPVTLASPFRGEEKALPKKTTIYFLSIMIGWKTVYLLNLIVKNFAHAALSCFLYEY